MMHVYRPRSKARAERRPIAMQKAPEQQLDFSRDRLDALARSLAREGAAHRYAPDDLAALIEPILRAYDKSPQPR